MATEVGGREGSGEGPSGRLAWPGLLVTLFGLITLHLAAVLKHHFVDGGRTAVRRMVG